MDSEYSTSESKLLEQTNNKTKNKRKESKENEGNLTIKRKKIKEAPSDNRTLSPVPSVPTIQNPEMWNPERLTLETLFILGSHAHKVLGLSNARGPLYTRHAGLLRYPADAVDKEWMVSHNLVNALAGKTYIMVLADIEELAKSEAYKHTSLPMLDKQSGFKVPLFMLQKIKAYVLKRSQSGDIGNADSPVPSTSTQDDDTYRLEDINMEYLIDEVNIKSDRSDNVVFNNMPDPAIAPQAQSSGSVNSSLMEEISSDPLSPFAFVVCELTPSPTPTTSQPLSSHHLLRDEDDDNIMNNYGSESDDDSGDEGPAARRSFVYYAQEDSPQEIEAAGEVDTNNEVTDDIEGVVEGPTSLYDFEWKTFPSVPIAPVLRREVFVGSSGPMIKPTSSPYDAFVKIWDRPIMEQIAQQTNAYAQVYAASLLGQGLMGPSSRIARWKDTNADELYVFFAILVAMGIVIKENIDEYWCNSNDIFSTPGFTMNISYNRFHLLYRCLHFNSNFNLSQNCTRSEAKLHKIKPIVDHLNSKFSALYGLGQNIALDESLTMWRGPLNIKQHIPNKAAAVGIKTYEVCDSRTGYLWRFEVYAGGEAQAEQDLIKGAIPNLVLRLLRGLEHRGHTVWMDNYYNSPALARLLKTLGFDCAGTLRTNRQFVPEEIAGILKSDMRVGQVSGCTSGDVDLLVWRDKNRVAMISTYHGIGVSENKPILVRDYNVCMGGVDKKDQMLAGYPMERKRTHVWYKKIFRRLLNVSVLNAYIIHKHNTPIDHRAFRVALVNELLSRHNRRADVHPLPPPRIPCPPRVSAEVISHMPFQLPTLPSGSKSGRQKRKCVVCSKRTAFMCKACNAALCFIPLPDCYRKYHTTS